MVEQYGDAFSYQQCPRAKIFARNHSDVSDLSSMIKLMRYMYVYVCMSLCYMLHLHQIQAVHLPKLNF